MSAHGQLLKKRHERKDVSRPSLRAVLPYAILAPLPALLALFGLTSWRLPASISAGLLTMAVARGGLVVSERIRKRSEADEWIRAHPRGSPSSELVARRMRQLSSPRLRRQLARSLRETVVSARRPPSLSGSVLNRRAVRRHERLLTLLADRLDDVGQSATACGVRLTLDLLTDGASPLYHPQRAAELGPTITRILDYLDG